MSLIDCLKKNKFNQKDINRLSARANELMLQLPPGTNRDTAERMAGREMLDEAIAERDMILELVSEASGIPVAELMPAEPVKEPVKEAVAPAVPTPAAPTPVKEADQTLVPVSKRSLTTSTEAPKLTVPSIVKEPSGMEHELQQLGATSGEWKTIQKYGSKSEAEAALPKGAGWRIRPETTDVAPVNVPERFKTSKSPVLIMKGSHVPGAEYTAYENGTRTHLDKSMVGKQSESSGADAVKIAMRYRTADDIVYANDAARKQLADSAEEIASQHKAQAAEQSRREEASRKDQTNRTALSSVLEGAKFKKGEFTPIGADGKKLPAISGHSYGPFLVHKSEGHFLRGQEYTVSHPATGFAILHGFKSLTSAKQAAVRLARSGPFDKLHSAQDFKKDEFEEARRIGAAIKKAGGDALADVSDSEAGAAAPADVAPKAEPGAAPADKNIGREWNSTYGKQRIVNLVKHPTGDLYQVETVGKGEIRQYRPDQIEDVIKKNEHHLTPEYAAEQAEAVETNRLRAERDARAAAARAAVDAKIAEFTAAKKMSVINAEKARLALTKNVAYRGSPISRESLIEKFVAEGRTIGTHDGKRTLETADGSFMDESPLTKTGMDYAEYLIAQRKAAPDAQPTVTAQPAAQPTITAQPDGRIAVTGLPADKVRSVRDLLGIKGAIIGANGNAIFPKGTNIKALRESLGVSEPVKPAAATATAPAAERPLSVGLKAKGGALNTEPVTVRDGVVHIGDDPATNLEGENITVPADAGNAVIKQALETGGALTTAQRVYGGEPAVKSQGIAAVENPHTAATLRAALIAAHPEMKSLLDNGTVQIVTAEQAGRVLGEPVTARDKAFFNPEDGTTYFIAEHIGRATPLKGLIKHEVAVHAYQLGRTSAEFKDILRQVDAMKGAEVEAARASVPSDTPVEYRAEEVLAYLVQNNPTLGIVKRFIAWFRNAIRAIGWNAPLSVNDLAYMADRAMTGGMVVARGGDAMRSVVRADGYNIIRDPGRQQAANLIARSEAGDLRGIRDPKDGSLYVWDAYKATHQDAAEVLGIDYKKAERLIFSAKELADLPPGVFSDEPGYRVTHTTLPKPTVGEAKMTHEEFQKAFFSRGAGYGAPMPSERQAAFQKLSTVGEFLGTLWNNDKSLSPWMKSVGTQYHTAATLAKQGKHEFKRVFDKGQDFLDDVSAFSLKAENLAPTLFPRFKKVGDIFKRGLGASKADTQAIARPLYDGTLANKVWKDAELISKFGLNQTQIKLYREALSAVNQSVFDLAKAIIVKHAKLNDILVDREMPLPDLSAHVQKALNMSKAPETAERIDRAVADVKAIESKAIGLRAHGYFPLMRFGEHTVTMRDANNEVTAFSMFDSQLAANRAAEALALENPNQTVEKGVLSKKSWKLYGGLNLDALELFAEHTDKETLEPYQEYLRTAVSGNSAMKRMLQRKGTAGFSENVERTVAQMLTSNARHISALYNMGDMRKLVNAVPQGDIKDHAVDLFTYLSDANEEAAALRGFLFFNYIGGSVASAMVNLTQIPTMSAPFLTQYADVGRVTKALVGAARLKRGQATGDLKAAWTKAEEEGITAPQEIHQLTAQASNRLWAGSHGMQRFFKAWGGMFEMAESFNRETTFVAAFNIAKENGKSAVEAYSFAKDAVEQTQGIYNKGNRPTWGRGAIGATIFTFKQFSIMYLELLQRMPAKQRMLMLGVLMLAAGGEGEPFYDDITDMIDTVMQWLGYATNTKRAIRNGVKEALGEDVGSFALQGVSSILPIDVQGRMSMSNLLPGTSYFKQSAVDKGRESLEVLGVVGSLIQNIGSAVENFAVGNTGGVIKSIAPVAVKNAYQGLEMLATGHGVDIKGRKTMDVSESEAAAKMIGFSPRPIAELGKAQRELMQDRNLQRVKEDEIVSMIVRGRLDNDPEAVAKGYSTLKKWNETNPELPIRIAPTQIQSRIRAAKMSSEQRFIKGTAPELRAAITRELRD